MTLEAIAYVSSSTGSLSERDLETLLERARSKNQELDITGALLYHDGTFFQYFEGPPAGVQEVYDRVQRSPLHKGLIELMRAPIARRAFTGWSMGFTRAPKSTLLKLSGASWMRTLQPGPEAGETTDGLALLLHFWHSSASTKLPPSRRT